MLVNMNTVFEYAASNSTLIPIAKEASVPVCIHLPEALREDLNLRYVSVLSTTRLSIVGMAVPCCLSRSHNVLSRCHQVDGLENS